MAARGHRLGIDFGTSNTVAALAAPDGRVRPLLFDGSPLLPSAVFAAAGGGLLVGADALRAAVGSPAGLEANPKRRIDDGTVWLGEREVPVAELVAAVLARVGAEAGRVAGRSADEVVLTHPATWQRQRLGILTEAADRAELGPVRFVAEPVAAAGYFAAITEHRVRAGASIVVYDFGAGTFDVSVVRPTAGGFEVVASDGLSDVGGLDLDAAVVRHARTVTGDDAAAWQRLDWPQTAADQLARHSLWAGARAVKEQLSRHPSGDLHLPLVDRAIHLTRDEFEGAARIHLDRTAELTRAVLRTAGVPPEDVAGVFLVGGSSRIPLAATLLHRALRIAPTVIDQPELVVAEGALHTEATPSAVASAPSAAAPAPSVAVPEPSAAVSAPVAVVPAPPAAVPAPSAGVSAPSAGVSAPAATVAAPSGAGSAPAQRLAPGPPAAPLVPDGVASAARPPGVPLVPPPTPPATVPPAATAGPPPQVRATAPRAARGNGRVAGTLLAAAGLLVYLFGLVGSMVVASSGSFINEQGFQGNEEIAALMVLAVSPGGVMIALGTAVAARGRAHRWRVAGWAAAALLLLAAPLGWVGHWDDGGQGGLIPAPIAPAIVCLLVAAVAVSRRPAPGAG